MICSQSKQQTDLNEGEIAVSPLTNSNPILPRLLKSLDKSVNTSQAFDLAGVPLFPLPVIMANKKPMHYCHILPTTPGHRELNPSQLPSNLWNLLLSKRQKKRKGPKKQKRKKATSLLHFS